MRFALLVKPRNLLLFACHFTNTSAQVVQLGRFINYNYVSPESYREEDYIKKEEPQH